MENIKEYLTSLPVDFLTWVFVWYTVRVLIGRLKAVKYSIKNLFRFFR